MQAKNIQIVSNIDLLNCSFSNSKVEHISSVDELNKYLETNQEKLIQTDEKLQAQNELLEKGIPVCPSCFALCIEEENLSDSVDYRISCYWYSSILKCGGECL